MIIKWKLSCAVVLGLGGLTVPLHGQGFPNVTQTPGRLLTPLLAPQQGRTAVIAYNNDETVRGEAFAQVWSGGRLNSQGHKFTGTGK